MTLSSSKVYPDLHRFPKAYNYNLVTMHSEEEWCLASAFTIKHSAGMFWSLDPVDGLIKLSATRTPLVLALLDGKLITRDGRTVAKHSTCTDGGGSCLVLSKLGGLTGVVFAGSGLLEFESGLLINSGATTSPAADTKVITHAKTVTGTKVSWMEESHRYACQSSKHAF